MSFGVATSNIFDLLGEDGKSVDLKKKAGKETKEKTSAAKPAGAAPAKKAEEKKKPAEAKAAPAAPKAQGAGKTGAGKFAAKGGAGKEGVKDDKQRAERPPRAQRPPRQGGERVLDPAEDKLARPATSERPLREDRSHREHREAGPREHREDRPAPAREPREPRDERFNRKRAFDRHQSGTGRLATENKKSGGGRGNWGKEGEEVSEAQPQATEAAENAEKTEEVKEVTEETPAEAEAPKKEEDPDAKLLSYEEYLRTQSAKPVSVDLRGKLRQANEGSDDPSWKTFAKLDRADEDVVLVGGKKKAEKKAAPAAATPAKKDGAVPVDQVLQLQFPSEDRGSGKRGGRRSGPPRRGGASSGGAQQVAKDVQLNLTDASNFPSLVKA